MDHHRVEVAILKQENQSLSKQAQTLKEENVRLADENYELRETVRELETAKMALKSKVRHQEKQVNVALKKLCAGILGKGKGGLIKINIKADPTEQEDYARHVKKEEPDDGGTASKPTNNNKTTRGKSNGRRPAGRPGKKKRTMPAQRQKRKKSRSSVSTDAVSELNPAPDDDDMDDTDINDEGQQHVYVPIKMEPSYEVAENGHSPNAIVPLNGSSQSSDTVRYKCFTCPVKFESIFELKQHQVDCLVQFDCRVVVPRCDSDLEADEPMELSSPPSSPTPTTPTPLPSSSPTMANELTPKQPHKCRQFGCEKVYQHKIQLEHHMRTHLMIRTSPRARPAGDEQPFTPLDALQKYACKFAGCTMVFSSKYAYKAHKVDHSEDKPFKCSFPGCGEKFNFQSLLISHLKVHDEPGSNNNTTKAHNHQSELVENELCQ